MNLRERVEREIGRLTDSLSRMQSQDGSWKLCCENVVLTEAYMILLLRTLEDSDEELIRSLHDRLRGFMESLPRRRRGQSVGNGRVLLCDALFRVQPGVRSMDGESKVVDRPRRRAYSDTRFNDQGDACRNRTNPLASFLQSSSGISAASILVPDQSIRFLGVRACAYDPGNGSRGP